MQFSQQFQGNAFQVSHVAGEGFRPDNVEQKSLTNIDEQLRSIMPLDSYYSIMGSNSINESTNSKV